MATPANLSTWKGLPGRLDLARACFLSQTLHPTFVLEPQRFKVKVCFNFFIKLSNRWKLFHRGLYSWFCLDSRCVCVPGIWVFYYADSSYMQSGEAPFPYAVH